MTADGGPLLLPVTLQKKRYLFVLDTGSSHSVYDKSLLRHLGKRVDVKPCWSPGGEVILSVYRSPAAKLGSLDLPSDSLAFCEDLGPFREACGQEIFGILGMDFLSEHIVRIDFDRGEVAFLRDAGREAGQRVPLTFRQEYAPHVAVSVPGLAMYRFFLVDTGDLTFGSGSLSTEDFTSLRRIERVQLAGKVKAWDLSGERTALSGRLDALSLAGHRHSKLTFHEANRNILGLNYLSRYMVTFDFPDKMMYLKKGRQFDQPESRDASGLSLVRKKRQTLVESVERGSPAFRAGVKAKDVLVTIDGIPAADMSLLGIIAAVSAEGKKHRLLIRRADKEMVMTIDPGDSARSIRPNSFEEEKKRP